MSEKKRKIDNRYARNYALKHSQQIAMEQMLYLYNLPLAYRFIAALSIIFRWGAVKVMPKDAKGETRAKV